MKSITHKHTRALGLLAALAIFAALALIPLRSGSTQTPPPATFSPATGSPISTGANPRLLTSGELNADNNFDLVIPNSGSDNLHIRLGNGDGTFAAATTVSLPASSQPWATLIGDVPGVGNTADIVSINRGATQGSVTLLAGPGFAGPGTTLTLPTNARPQNGVFGNVNTGAAGNELIVANTNQNTLSIFSGSAYATRNEVSVTGSPFGLGVADFDADGFQDIAVAISSNIVQVLFGNGSGNVYPRTANLNLGTSPTGISAQGLAVGDFNGDGRPDIAASSLKEHVAIFLNIGGGAFAAAANFPAASGAETFWIQTGDLDNDGKLDLAVTNNVLLPPGFNVITLKGFGDGAFGSQRGFATGATGVVPYGLTLANFNDNGGDNELDMAASNRDSANAAILLNNPSNLTIVKTDSPDPVIAGNNLTYTLTVTNNGPDPANLLTVSDTLPAATTFVSVDTTGAPSFNCSGTSTVTCTSPFLANAGVAVIKITAKVAASTPAGSISNTATVTAATFDPSTPNSSTATTAVTTAADLSLLKLSTPDPVIAGNNVTYVSTITNNGPSNSGAVTFTDVLDANTTFVSADTTQAPGFTCAGTTTITCAGPIMVPGAQVKISITARVSPSFLGASVTNNASVATTNDPNTSNNTSNAPTNVIRRADLTIVKSGPSSAVAGQDYSYTLLVTNGGPSDAQNVVVTDVLPAGINFRALNLSAAPSFTMSTTPAVGTNGTVTVKAPTLAAGASQTIIIIVRPSASLPDNTSITNTATIASDTVDPNTGNNSSTTTLTIRVLADLGVAKTATAVVDPDGAGPLAPVALPVVGPNVPPGSVNAGGYIRYDVPFGNAGPSDSQNVRLTDVIPGNTAFVGALATGGVFVPVAQPPSVPFNFTIQVTQTASPNVNLACAVAGAPGSQQITCTPSGNTGLTPPYADGALPAGYTGTLTYFVKVNESVQGGAIVANPANITSAPNGTTPGTPDPNTGNNTSLPTQTVVIASSNLAITKIVQSAVTAASNPNQTGPIGPATAPNGAATTGTAVLPGTYLTYRVIITNNGPSDVSNIRLTDILPSGLETPPGRVLGVRYVSVSPVLPSGATFTCSPPTGVNPSNNPQLNGGSAVCTAPLLSANAPNNVAAVDITVFIDPATKASLVNTAAVDATLNNFNRPVSGTAVLTTPVAPTSDLALAKSHAPDPVIAGTSFDYTITLTNNGPSAAQMVNVVDTLPLFQKVTAIQIQQTPDQNGAPNFSCAATPAVGSPGNTTSVACTAAELPPNKKPDGTVNLSGTVKFILTVTQDALTPQPTPASYQNCVTATSMSTDPIPANNTNVCDTVNVIFRADLSGTKTDSPDPVIAGNLLTYTITANNAGPSAALNLKINDPLPQGTVFISAAASPGATVITPSVSANGTVMATWDAAGGTPGGLTGPGVPRTLTIVVRVCANFQQILGLTDAQMCVPNLTDTATFSSATTDPNPGNNTASATTTVQAQSNLSISKSAPAKASYSTSIGPSDITYTINFSNAGPSNSSGTVIVDVLPKGFTVVGTPISTVPGTTFTFTTTSGVTTVTAKLGVLGAANQCGGAQRPTSGTITIVARVPIKHPTITVTNTATISTTNCLSDPNLDNNTATANTYITPPAIIPGDPFPALAEASDQKEGSVLFYPIYTSDAASSTLQNTRISITNTSTTERVTVHLFAVDGASCAVLDAFLCLTPNQTTSFLASDFDPGNSGYVVAVAVDDNTGLPRAFNELIGDEYVKFASGHQANLGAEAIAATMMFPAGTNPNVTSATLKFDGVNYNRLPRVLAAGTIPSANDGNSTMLIVNRVGGDFALGGAQIGAITGLLFNDEEVSFSFTANQSSCQFRSILSNTFPRTFTPFIRVIDAGHSGWMKFWAVDDSRGSEKALFGALINFNPGSKSIATAYNQGHNLHKLTLTDKAEIVVPIFIPGC